MTVRLFRAVVPLLALVLAACAAAPQAQAPAAVASPAPLVGLTPAERWQAAIQDAAVPTDAKRANDLIALLPATPGLSWRNQNTEVKMVAWMSQATYDNYYSGDPNKTTPPGSPVVWVTAAPQVQQFCQNLPQQGRSQRIKEHLGLSIDRAYDVFVEMWVPVAGLIRPCPDQEVTDTSCDVGTGPTVTDAPWWANLYRTSYLVAGAPWTRLGYTYDWAEGVASRKGASEFMIKPSTAYEIAGHYTTDVYCTAAQ